MQVIPAEAWDWAEKFGMGTPVTYRKALAYAYSRVNGRVDAGAYESPAYVSRDLELTAPGQTQQTTIQIGTALIVTSLYGRVYLPEEADDSSMLSVQLQLPNTQGLLLGDGSNWVNWQLFAENAVGIPLPTPWVLFPSDQTVWLGRASNALTGTASMSLGLQGNWIYGLI